MTSTVTIIFLLLGIADRAASHSVGTAIILRLSDMLDSVDTNFIFLVMHYTVVYIHISIDTPFTPITYIIVYSSIGMKIEKILKNPALFAIVQIAISFTWLVMFDGMTKL